MEAKMVVKNILMLTCILFCISLACASEVNLILDINKKTFVPNDNIIIYAYVNNTDNNPVHINLDTYMINDKETYPTAIIPFEFDVESNKVEIIEIYNISVDEEMPSDNYTVNARLSVNSEHTKTEDLRFEVKDTLKEIKVDIEICEDISCSKRSRTFIQNRNIYLNYSSNDLGIKVTAILESPDKKTRNIDIPGVLKGEQVGSYNLEIYASKEGYMNLTKIEQFGVIEKQANISTTESLDIEKMNKEIEDYQEKISKKNNLKMFILIPLIILFIILLILLIIRLRNSKGFD